MANGMTGLGQAIAEAKAKAAGMAAGAAAPAQSALDGVDSAGIAKDAVTPATTFAQVDAELMKLQAAVEIIINYLKANEARTAHMEQFLENASGQGEQETE